MNIPDLNKLAALRARFPLPWPVVEQVVDDGYRGNVTQPVLLIGGEEIKGPRELLEFLELCGQFANSLEVRRQTKAVDPVPMAKQD